MCKDMNRSASSPLAMRGAVFERHVTIVVARQHHLDAHLGLELARELFRHPEHHVFFRRSADADGAGILAAVAGIQDDLAKAACRRWRFGFSRLGCRPRRPTPSSPHTSFAGSFPLAARPAMSITSRVGSAMRKILCARSSFISSTTRTLSPPCWPIRTWRRASSSHRQWLVGRQRQPGADDIDVDTRRQSLQRIFF